MKKLFLTLFLTVITTAMLQAQQISVVSSGGTTKLYRTLADAINGASSGSVIYLPGGGFAIGDSVKITKKLTIIGIGHYIKNDNVDGVTTISGNLFFNEGSSGSAVLACYITGDVNIGDGGTAVNEVLIRCCNLNSVQVKNSLCQDAEINQNYIRNMSSFYNTNAKISNNIAHTILNVDGGSILNNIVTTYYQTAPYTGSAYSERYYMISASNSVIRNNITIGLNGRSNNYGQWRPINGSNNQLYENMALEDVGESSIIVSDWNDVFKNYNNGSISPTSNFHFKEDYQQYENQVGIYAGDSFNDNQLAPVPYIVAKKVDQQTDAQGKLNVKIRVKAGQ